MAAPKGNQFWKARSTYGRGKIFSTPEALWDAACEYFEWVEENPLFEEKAWCTQGEVTKEPIQKMRAMTLTGLARFLHIDFTTWVEYTKLKAYSHDTRQIEEIVYEQKFSGAAADLLNANIIARDLGLKDQSKSEHTGKDGGPIEFRDMTSYTDEQLQAIINGEPGKS